jgi:hypothetical protein
MISTRTYGPCASRLGVIARNRDNRRHRWITRPTNDSDAAPRRASFVPRASSSSPKKKTDAKNTPLGLPITYHVDPPRPARGTTFKESRCEPTEQEEHDSCSIRDATEVYDSRCKACGGNKLVMSMTRSGAGKRYKETISTCQVCGGTGYVRVSSSRVPADASKGDVEAAHFEHFPKHGADAERDKRASGWNFRRNMFEGFEDEAKKKNAR